jgi:hypothetical protein
MLFYENRPSSHMNSIPLIVSVILAALTPAKVSEVKSNPEGAKPPRVIYVKQFSIPQTIQSENAEGGRPRLLGRVRGGKDQTIVGQHREGQKEEVLANTPAALQKALIADLNQSVAAAAEGEGADISPDCWVITGQLVEVNMGNRALQAGVGFGAGQSDLEVQAKVYSGRNLEQPFLTFDSKGASGHMPGAVVTKNPYVAAAKFVISRRQPDLEAKKAASSIAHEIGKFMDAQGLPKRIR